MSQEHIGDNQGKQYDSLLALSPLCRADPWPLVVDYPLLKLCESLEVPLGEEPNWLDAYYRLKDTSEGVARLIWIVLISETLKLTTKADSLESVEEKCRPAIKLIFDSMRSGFTLGNVSFWLLRKQHSVYFIEPLVVELERYGLSLTSKLFEYLDSFVPHLNELRVWRNQDPGHGVLGNRDRIREMLAPDKLEDKKMPLYHLRECLCKLAPWLTRAQETLAERGWIPLVDLEKFKDQMDFRPLLAPVSYSGKGNPLWLIESASHSEIFLRCIITNEKYSMPLIEVEEWSKKFLRSTGPLMLPFGEDHGRPIGEEQIDKSMYDERSVTVEPLIKHLDQLLVSNKWIGVSGLAGSGKSFLLRQFEDHVRQKDPKYLNWVLPETSPICLSIYTQPGVPLSNVAITNEINSSLIAAAKELVTPILLPSGSPLSSVPQEACLWWKKFGELNSNYSFLVFVDTLDEAGGIKGGDSLLPVLPPFDCKNIWTVVSYRDIRNLPARPKDLILRGADNIAFFDIHESYENDPECLSIFRRYLRKRHRVLRQFLDYEISSDHLHLEAVKRLERLVGRSRQYSLENVIIAYSGQRFLWLFHYARGVEEGILSLGEIQRWPTVDTFYSYYLLALERRSGFHPVYVGTLRRILLTISNCAPLNDQTLLYFLSDNRGKRHKDEGADSQLENSDDRFAVEWVYPILDDLSDFIQRTRVEIHMPLNDVMKAAAWINFDDLNGRSGAPAAVTAPFVRSIIHSSLIDYLRGDGVEEEIRGQREEVLRRLKSKIRKLFDYWKQENDAQGDSVDKEHSAPVRYAQAYWYRHYFVNDEELDQLGDLINAYLSYTKDDLVNSVYREHWMFSLGNITSTVRELIGIDLETDGDVTQEEIETYSVTAMTFYSLILSRYGRLLGVCNRVPESIVIHREAVKVRRILAKIDKDYCETRIALAVDESPEELENLEISLGNLGEAYAENGQNTESIAAHEKEVIICRHLAGIKVRGKYSILEFCSSLGKSLSDFPEGPIRVAIVRNQERLRHLAISLVTLSDTQLRAQQYESALENIQEAISLCLIRAGLPPSFSNCEVKLAAANNQSAIADLAGYTLRLVRAKAVYGQSAKEAAESAEQAIFLGKVLLGLSDGYSDSEILIAANIDPKGVLRLAEAFSDYGNLLIEINYLQQDYGHAIVALKEALKLLRIVAQLPENYRREDLTRAIREYRQEVFQISKVADRLGKALREDESSLKILLAKTAVDIDREVSSLAPDYSQEDLKRAIEMNRSSVASFAISLGHLGQAVPDVKESMELAAESLYVHKELSLLGEFREEQIRRSIELHSSSVCEYSVQAGKLLVALFGNLLATNSEGEVQILEDEFKGFMNLGSRAIYLLGRVNSLAIYEKVLSPDEISLALHRSPYATIELPRLATQYCMMLGKFEMSMQRSLPIVQKMRNERLILTHNSRMLYQTLGESHPHLLEEWEAMDAILSRID